MASITIRDVPIEARDELAARAARSGRSLHEYLRRFGNYVPPVLEHLGLAEVEHNARNNRVRAISG